MVKPVGGYLPRFQIADHHVSRCYTHWIQLVSLDKEEMREARRLLDVARIGQGQAEALVLSRRRDASAVLDDKEARARTKGWNLQYTSPVMVLFEAFKREVIGYDELVEGLSKLTRHHANLNRRDN